MSGFPSSGRDFQEEAGKVSRHVSMPDCPSSGQNAREEAGEASRHVSMVGCLSSGQDSWEETGDKSVHQAVRLQTENLAKRQQRLAKEPQSKKRFANSTA